MKGYIYKLFAGADPASGWIFNDPIFGTPPTLGACVPNLRRLVERGDWVFCISGRVKDYRPYLVGGFQVEEKIDALSAYRRFPQYRLQEAQNGQVVGNVIVDRHGRHNKLDNHTEFENRVRNYLVGGDAVHVSRPEQVEQAREETLPALSQVFDIRANRTSDLVPRWRRLDETQIDALRRWLTALSE